jgi:RNA polymerase-binding transcription factor DksA
VCKKCGASIEAGRLKALHAVAGGRCAIS